MYAVVRRYTSEMKNLAEVMAEKHEDLERRMSGLPGFVAYYLIDAGDAVATVTVCDDRAGAEASHALAAEWVKQNLPASVLGAPEATGGEVLAHAG
ncbi:MAG: hypothetical protein QOJ59_3716 [Thermomicrobiales bacterium]|nr:hypothetical protein [Thermomicrobiales bacterium]